MLADYYVKITNQHHLTPRELVDLEFVPHQNDHLKVMATISERIQEHLAMRATFIVTLDQPLLVICDEPVVLERPDDYKPPSKAELRDHSRRVAVDGVPPEDLIHFQGTGGVGLVNAATLAMPLGPRHALVYAAPGRREPIPHQRLNGDEAEEFATEMVGLCVAQAMDWIAAHPDRRTLPRLRMPPARPPLTIFDGGTPLSLRLQKSKRRRPHRLNRDVAPEEATEAF